MTTKELEQFGTWHEDALARLMEKLPNLRSLKLRKLIAHGSASLLGHYEPETRPLHLDRLHQFIRLTTLEIAQLSDPEVEGLAGVVQQSECLQNLHLTAAYKSRVAITNRRFGYDHELQPMVCLIKAMYEIKGRSEMKFPPCPEYLTLLRSAFPSFLRSLTLQDNKC